MTEMETKVREAAKKLARTIIATLRATMLGELAGLVGPHGATTGARAKRPGRPAKPRKATPAKAALPKKTTATKRAVPAKAGTVIRRSDGRTFTNTAKAIAAHRLQGQYLACLRRVPEKQRDRLRSIAHEKGVAAAVTALKKQQGKA
jgi:hypothetical protein